MASNSLVTGGGGGVTPTDHGALTGRADDDHLQYYNQARADARYLQIANVTDRRATPVLRANAVAGVAPTVGEHASPITGDTAIVILNDGKTEYYRYTTVWGLITTVAPVSFDGSHTPIARANALTNIPPTVGEVPSPVEGDSASVFLNDGTIENWYRNATVWALINTITPVTSDGNSVWIPRANATTGVAPTVGEVSAPVSGDTAIVLLNDGKKEYWTYTTLWTLTATDSPAGVTALTQVQVEDSASVVEGSVTGQRLAQSVAANELGIKHAYIDSIARAAETGYTVTTADIAKKRIFRQESDNTLWTPLGTAGAVTWVQIGGGTATTTDLTFGRVKATATLTSTSFSITAPGTKVPFDTAFYFSGTTVGIDSITVSQTGRYRCSWFMLCGSGEFNGDGTFHVVSGGVSLGSVFVDMMQAAGVNQIANFIDVNLDAGATVELRYQPVVADAVPWGAGSYFQVDQLPTAVAPVVNTVAEYGNASLTFSEDANNNAGVWVDRGVSVTIPSAGVYRIRWNASAEIGSAATTQVVMAGRLYNTTTATAYSKTAGTICNNDNETAVQTNQVGCGTGEDIITVTGATVITFQTRINAIASAIVLLLGESAVYGRTYVSYEKIAGQLPSTGATVDYVNALQATAVAANAGNPLLFDTISSGNIPYVPATGLFSLTAGKTYRLSFFGQQSTIARMQWQTAAGTPLNNSLMMIAATNNLSGYEVIYTPSVNENVKLTALDTTVFQGGRISATIIQIGSTNTIGGNTNVNDQSSSGYFDVGNMRMQWGTFIQGSGANTVTLPAAFANTSYVVTGNDQTSVSSTTVRGTSFSSLTTTQFTSLTNSTNATTVNAAAGNTIGYFAIGQKP